jgi:hypothetical protein
VQCHQTLKPEGSGYYGKIGGGEERYRGKTEGRVMGKERFKVGGRGSRKFKSKFFTVNQLFN